MSSAEPSDTDLLMRWRGGESAAGERLFARHFARVERFFVNKVDPDHVADLVQETFVACVEGRDRIRDGGRFRSYLLGIAHNVLRGFLRRKYSASIDSLDHSIASLSQSPSSVLAKQDDQRLLLEALRSLPVRYQVVLELHYWEDLGTADIAEVLAVPQGTARSRLRRAREALEAALARLSRARDKLESTLTRLDDWAAACGRELFGS